MKNTNFKMFLRDQFNFEHRYVDIKPFAYCFKTTRLVKVKDEGGEAVIDEEGREIDRKGKERVIGRGTFLLQIMRVADLV